ncbi:fasciclin domain-containing protein [Motilibacter aurantiacus]|uniref:fasciclin domain-containing protein n=1 Tax=Motilibacter aurantiacus TaxID=2714955 RepID=UPI00140CA73B|nr:fasciclin domain-containing protein [Motilibacter aurantiacus]NHC45826.1 fasciclin domain-containing protein [Motilibacter aurantiacus]
MNLATRKPLAVAGVLAALTLGLTACGDDGDDTAASTTGEAGMSSTMPTMPMTPSATPSMEASMGTGGTGTASGPVGPGCADYAAAVPSGAGSVEGMAQDPVATAASNNPLLKTLVSAVSGKLNPKVDLVDTLNGGEFTVFAPVDEAFAKIDAKTLETLKTDDALLTQILTYHVVPGQLSPEQVVGMQTTVEGDDVDVTGSGDSLKVNDANVICGGVQTANATVYLIDSVLMPTS